jgi:hypothetical protein
LLRIHDNRLKFRSKKLCFQIKIKSVIFAAKSKSFIMNSEQALSFEIFLLFFCFYFESIFNGNAKRFSKKCQFCPKLKFFELAAVDFPFTQFSAFTDPFIIVFFSRQVSSVSFWNLLTIYLSPSHINKISDTTHMVAAGILDLVIFFI